MLKYNMENWRAILKTTNGIPSIGDLKDPMGGVGSISELAGKAFSAALPIVGMLFVGLLIYGGIQYIVSAGNSQKIKAAEGIMTSAVIGLVIVLAAFAIKALIAKILNVGI